MILNGVQLTFEQETLFKEITLRGRCLMLSADMESLLLKITLYCIIDAPEKIVREFESMGMGGKIQMAKLDMKKYKPDQYKKYKDLFKKLESFNKLRVKLAHRDITWDENKKSTSFIYVHELKKIKGEYRFIKNKLSITDIDKKIEMFKKDLTKIVDILMTLSEEFNQKHPSFFNSSQV